MVPSDEGSASPSTASPTRPPNSKGVLFASAVVEAVQRMLGHASAAITLDLDSGARSPSLAANIDEHEDAAEYRHEREQACAHQETAAEERREDDCGVEGAVKRPDDSGDHDVDVTMGVTVTERSGLQSVGMIKRSTTQAQFWSIVIEATCCHGHKSGPDREVVADVPEKPAAALSPRLREP